MYTFDVHAAYAFDVCLDRSHFNLIIIWFFSFSAIANTLHKSTHPRHAHTVAPVYGKHLLDFAYQRAVHNIHFIIET